MRIIVNAKSPVQIIPEGYHVAEINIRAISLKDEVQLEITLKTSE